MAENELTEEQVKRIIAILNSEIILKKDKLEHDITELNILKIDNSQVNSIHLSIYILLDTLISKVLHHSR